MLSIVVRRSLADTNEEGIRAFHRSLVEAKHVIGGDLQRNVYRNYTEFVTISKEVSNLDADVFRLKGYLNELKSIWESFMEDANPSEDMKPIGKKSISRWEKDDLYILLLDAIGLNDAILPQRKHSDIIPSDLQSIFRAQIAALWENVEGSQVRGSILPLYEWILTCGILAFCSLYPWTSYCQRMRQLFRHQSKDSSTTSGSPYLFAE